MFVRFSYRLETPKFWCLQFTKLQFLKKLSPVVHFVYSFPIIWIFGIIHQILQKDSSKKGSLQILMCSQLQAKHLVITQEKNDGVKMVLSYR